MLLGLIDPTLKGVSIMEQQTVTTSEPIQVAPQINGEAKKRQSVTWVFTDRQEAFKAHEAKQKDKTGKVEYQLYQVESNGKTLYSIGISPADAFGKCIGQLEAKVVLLTHKQPIVTVETMLASFDTFSEEQKKFLLDQILAKNPVEVKPEEEMKPKKGKKS